MPNRWNNLDAEDKLHVATQVLEDIAAVIASDKVEYKGTKQFTPFMIKDKITEKT